MNSIRKALAIFILMLAVQMTPAFGGQQGSMRYNYDTKRMEFHDGSGWYNFGLGLPVGTCAKEGAMDFDPLLTILGSYRFCNGTNWIQIVGLTTLSFCSKKAAVKVAGDRLLVCNGTFWVNIKGAPAPGV